MEKEEVETFITLAFKNGFDLDRRPKFFDSFFIKVLSNESNQDVHPPEFQEIQLGKIYFITFCF